MHMFSWDRTMFVDNMMALVREGKISVKRIDDAVKRILTVKFQLGLFEERYLKIDPEKQMYATAEAKILPWKLQDNLLSCSKPERTFTS